VAIASNFPQIFPGAMSSCRYHMSHHIYLGVRGKDNACPRTSSSSTSALPAS
jgi:hypothetical protein